MLNEIDSYTKGKYQKEIDTMRVKKEYQLILIEGKYSLLKEKRYKMIHKSNRKSYFVSLLEKHIPGLIVIYRVIKRKMWAIMPHKVIKSL